MVPEGSWVNLSRVKSEGLCEIGKRGAPLGDKMNLGKNVFSLGAKDLIDISYIIAGRGPPTHPFICRYRRYISTSTYVISYESKVPVPTVHTNTARGRLRVQLVGGGCWGAHINP